MSVTDQYVANDVVYRTLENGAADAAYPALFTTMYTSQQIIDTLNRVQQEFLLETGLIITRTTIVGQVGKSKYALPADSIRPRRLTWNDASDLLTRILTQDDTWDLDTGGIGTTGSVTWVADRDIPIVWWETTLPQQQVAVAFTPTNDGTIGLQYVALATTLTGTGTSLTIPDDFTPYILWGTLAEMFANDGPAFDPVRATYCRTRFDEGIELVRLILGG